MDPQGKRTNTLPHGSSPSESSRVSSTPGARPPCPERHAQTNINSLYLMANAGSFHEAVTAATLGCWPSGAFSDNGGSPSIEGVKDKVSDGMMIVSATRSLGASTLISTSVAS
jgi:hypothetical protein